MVVESDDTAFYAIFFITLEQISENLRSGLWQVQECGTHNGELYKIVIKNRLKSIHDNLSKLL